MILSHKKAFIFIHIFKTAGTSISYTLLPHARLIDKLVYYYPITRKIVGLIERLLSLQDAGQRYFTGFHKHSRALDIKRKLGSGQYFSYFTFCIVRNPYDHMVSLYHYIKGNKSHILHSKANELEFNSFVDFYIDGSPECQVDFIFENDECLINFLGRFENLDEDFRTICTRLGIKSKSLDIMNPSKRTDDFMQYFSDKGVLDRFNQYFIKDFLLLKYSIQRSPINLAR